MIDVSTEWTLVASMAMIIGITVAGYGLMIGDIITVFSGIFVMSIGIMIWDI